MTVWRPSPSYPEYEVSEDGRVKRILPDAYGRPIKELSLGKAARPRVCLTSNGKERLVHTHVLVCEAFHGPKPTPLHQVAHWDGDPWNNRKDNLRWATPKENADDRDRHGRTYRGGDHWSKRMPEKTVRGERNGCSKLTEQQAMDIMRSTGSAKIIGAQYGVSGVLVSMIRRGAAWKHLPR